jgi:hypothetical protein
MNFNFTKITLLFAAVVLTAPARPAEPTIVVANQAAGGVGSSENTVNNQDKNLI